MKRFVKSHEKKSEKAEPTSVVSRNETAGEAGMKKL